MPNEFFKGWAIPGPQIPDIVNASGELAPELAPGAGETLDALSGHYRIFQLRDGHRFSTDDLLTAWYGTLSCPSASRVLDLGSGIGSVGMIAAWRLQGARFVTIEAQSESVKLARKSAKMNGIENRYEIRESDFRSPDILKSEEKFDLILGSPPYFPIGSGVQSAHPQKDACRSERSLIIVRWPPSISRVAACLLAFFPQVQPSSVNVWKMRLATLVYR